jgi:tetratricopeptide (TPR) repeat protein
MTTLAQTFYMAIRHHQTGNFQQEEELYRHVLQVDSQHIDAWHLLGLIADHFGRHDLACDYINQALRLQPKFAVAYNSLGNVLRNLGRWEEAVASYQEALRLKPDYVASIMPKTLMTWCRKPSSTRINR